MCHGYGRTRADGRRAAAPLLLPETRLRTSHHNPAGYYTKSNAILQGTDLTSEELLGYISESSTMSKSIEEYEGARFGQLCQKSFADAPDLARPGYRFLLSRNCVDSLLAGPRAAPSLRRGGWASSWALGRTKDKGLEQNARELTLFIAAQAARAAPSRRRGGWASFWATSASRTRGSTATTWSRAAPRARPPRSAPSRSPSFRRSRRSRAPSCASGAATCAQVGCFCKFSNCCRHSGNIKSRTLRNSAHQDVPAVHS